MPALTSEAALEAHVPEALPPGQRCVALAFIRAGLNSLWLVWPQLPPLVPNARAATEQAQFCLPNIPLQYDVSALTGRGDKTCEQTVA